MLSRLSQYQECATKVRRHHFVKSGDVAFRDGRQKHDACVVDDDVNSAVGVEGLLEKLLHVRGIRYVRQDGDGLSASGLDFGHDFFGLGGVPRVVHYDREAVVCQPLRYHASNTARCAGDDGASRLCICHCSFSLLGRAGLHSFEDSARCPSKEQDTSCYHSAHALLEYLPCVTCIYETST